MTNLNRAALNAAFARHVARVLGPPAAYAPADTCPQGHARLWGDQIGDLCHVCYEYWRDKPLSFRRENPTWHPEWRIGPGAPWDFCGSMDRVIPALAALGCWWSAAMLYQGTRLVPMVLVTRYAGGQAQAGVTDLSQPAAWATALVWAALQLLDDREAPNPDGAGQEEA
jgi:hypothetical protein